MRKPRLFLIGNAQANALSTLLASLTAVSAAYEVLYSEDASPELRANDVLCMQLHEAAMPERHTAAGVRTIRFPGLFFGLLWPLNCVNQYNSAEPGFPHGRFPYGDSYVLNSVRSAAPPEEILAFCSASSWPQDWPNLDRLFQTESARLTTLDAACDVKIASYILKRFSRERLFHNPNAPSRDLLAELALRIARALLSVPIDAPTAQWPAEGALSILEAPVHPAVAAHFHLEWYSADLRYNYFGQEPQPRDEYFRRLIAHSYLEKARATRTLTLIVYGNCQAEAVASILRAAGAPHLRVLYLRSFDEPGDSPAQLALTDVVQCALLWEQHDELHPFPYKEWLAPECRVVRFPAADFNALWPFTCVNPFVRLDPPKYPFGRFPYGDRAILDCLDACEGADDVWNCYEGTSQQRTPDLDRFLALETARLQARDSKCDVKLAGYIIDNFRRRRLFWTVNHPSSELLAEVTKRLIHASAEFSELDGVAPEQVLKTRFEASGPLGVTSIPIHPSIAAHYGLEWYASDELFQNWGDYYTYEGYFRALIEESLEVRALLAHADATQHA